MLCITLYTSGSLYEKFVLKDLKSFLLLLIEAGRCFFWISEICDVEVKKRQTGSVFRNVHAEARVTYN